MKPVPHRAANGVPYCSEFCPLHDGKRCEVMGRSPDNICEPSVIAMREALACIASSLVASGETVADVAKKALGVA